MANEITKTVTLKVANGKDRLQGDATIYADTQATTRPATLVGQGSINVSTDAVITIPGVAAGNLGETLFYNLDADTTKYIDIGPASGGAIVPAWRIYGSGMPASVRLIPNTTYRAVASSGTQVMHMAAAAK